MKHTEFECTSKSYDWQGTTHRDMQYLKWMDKFDTAPTFDFQEQGIETYMVDAIIDVHVLINMLLSFQFLNPVTDSETKN